MNLQKIGWSAMLTGIMLLQHVNAAPTILNTPPTPSENQSVLQWGYGSQDYSKCSCLRDAENASGHGLRVDYASEHPVNMYNPRVGALILMKSKWYGHAGYVIGYTDTTVTFGETGWKSCWSWDTRTLQRNDGVIRGYYW